MRLLHHWSWWVLDEPCPRRDFWGAVARRELGGRCPSGSVVALPRGNGFVVEDWEQKAACGSSRCSSLQKSPRGPILRHDSVPALLRGCHSVVLGRKCPMAHVCPLDAMSTNTTSSALHGSEVKVGREPSGKGWPEISACRRVVLLLVGGFCCFWDRGWGCGLR